MVARLVTLLTAGSLAALAVACAADPSPAAPTLRTVPPSTSPSTTPASGPRPTSPLVEATGPPPSRAATTTSSTLPGTITANEVCDVLSSAGWEQRRAAILTYTAAFHAAGGQGPLVNRVREACPDALARQEAALRLEEAARTIGDRDLLEPHDPVCYDTAVAFMVHNRSTSPLGYVVTADTEGPTVDDLDSERPWPGATVVWSTEPGDRQLVADAGSPAHAGCRVQALWFLADESAADASLPAGGEFSDRPGDDPDAWLADLLRADLDFRHAPTIDGMARSRDVRAFVPIGRLGEMGSQDAAHRYHPVESARPCPDTLDRPAPDRAAFAYVVEFGPNPADPDGHRAFSELQYAAFRRNADGHWRFLTAPVVLTGTFTGAGCADLVPHP